jgi:hypothetical protein
MSSQFDKQNWRYHNKQMYKQYKAYTKRKIINEACDLQNSWKFNWSNIIVFLASHKIFIAKGSIYSKIQNYLNHLIK